MWLVILHPNIVWVDREVWVVFNVVSQGVWTGLSRSGESGNDFLLVGSYGWEEDTVLLALERAPERPACV